MVQQRLLCLSIFGRTLAVSAARREKGGEVAAAWLTFIETCKLQKKAAFDFFNDLFKKVTEGRSDYELIAQEVLGQNRTKTTKSNYLMISPNPSKCWG